MNASERIASIRAAMPGEGLFADKEWLVSPEPFRISAEFHDELQKLGYRLLLFQKACNRLYQQSVAGKQPSWVADYLDRGKPAGLIEFSRRKESRDDIPLVIRPDLVLTENGYVISELDSVPGGIGLTAWLNQTYASFGEEVIGGERGMIDGFVRMLGGEADILISEEAATYRPEMSWLAKQTNGALRVLADGDNPESRERQIFRFFELFDLANVRSANDLMQRVKSGAQKVTPPFKPYLEEKLWFALFWMRPLREFWRRELGERQWLKLQEVIPYTWIVNPEPLPHFATIPQLDVQSWEEVGEFSQKQRDLILKISGFSEQSWGSRGVTLGSDISQSEWKSAVAEAVSSFGHHPYILQRFHKAGVMEQSYADLQTGELKQMKGRVRLCPYYFVIGDQANLCGALATVCPADKKLLHGMRDAIMVPTAVSPAGE